MGKTDKRIGRTTRRVKAANLLPAQKLGIRTRGRVESSAQPDRDRFRGQEGASHAAPIRSGKSHSTCPRTFSCSKSCRFNGDQEIGKGRYNCDCAEHSRKPRRKSKRAANQ